MSQTKSVRAVVSTRDYSIAGIYDDFDPPDQADRNALLDEFFFETVPMKAALHAIEREVMSTKSVRREAIARIYSLQGSPGVRFHDVFTNSRLARDGKEPSREELETSPYNVLYRYDTRLVSPFNQLLKVLNSSSNGKSENGQRSGAINNGVTGAASILVFEGNEISSLTEAITTLIGLMNSTQFKNEIYKFGYV